MMKPGQVAVLQALVVLDDPIHSLPPLDACWTIIREPICVPPPHVLSHDCQVHVPHLQSTGRGEGRGGRKQAETRVDQGEKTKMRIIEYILVLIGEEWVPRIPLCNW